MPAPIHAVCCACLSLLTKGTRSPWPTQECAYGRHQRPLCKQQSSTDSPVLAPTAARADAPFQLRQCTSICPTGIPVLVPIVARAYARSKPRSSTSAHPTDSPVLAPTVAPANARSSQQGTSTDPTDIPFSRPLQQAQVAAPCTRATPYQASPACYSGAPAPPAPGQSIQLPVEVAVQVQPRRRSCATSKHRFGFGGAVRHG